MGKMVLITSIIDFFYIEYGVLIFGECTSEGVPHLREDETLPQGGRPGWAALPNPRIGPWLRLMQKVASDQGLVPEFEVFSFC